ncbi:alpha/beta fold hydrolase [Laceyella putida]|uniref:Alpha/beta fold hydrolase n=1 Tax=Laceyella putida TaxID=110101 RepID=A0ABW2RQA1_9BACL
MPFIETNGTQLHYHLAGQGPTLVFIHPPLITSAVFRYQMSELATSCRILTFDIRGHGQSAPSSAPLTFPLIVEDMRQLLDTLQIKQAYLCGYSTGGSIVLEALLSHPDRFVGGILISAMSEVSTPLLYAAIAIATGLCKSGCFLPLATLLSWSNADSPTTFANLYRSARQGHPENIKQYFAFSQQYNCTNRLIEIKQPMLLLYGNKDRMFHKYAKLLKFQLSRVTVKPIDNKRHQLPTKAGQQCNRLIQDWLHQQIDKKTLSPQG